MNRRTISWVSMSLLIAFAASTAAASISGSSVAGVLARERGIVVAADSVRLQVGAIQCGTLHITSVRSIGRELEVSLRCDQNKLPIMALVKDSRRESRALLITTNLTTAIPVVVRRGTFVQLLIHGDRSRITIRAVCLESAHIGQNVRVRIPGTHAIHIAKVVSPGVVIEEAA